MAPAGGRYEQSKRRKEDVVPEGARPSSEGMQNPEQREENLHNDSKMGFYTEIREKNIQMDINIEIRDEKYT